MQKLLKGKCAWSKQEVQQLCNAAGSYSCGLSLGISLPSPLPVHLTMENKQNDAFSWYIYKAKHMQLVLVTPVKWGLSSNPHTCCRHGGGQWEWAGHPDMAQLCCHSISSACTDSCVVTAPSKTTCNPEPLPGDKITSRFTSPIGRGNKQCHPQFVLWSPTDFRS